MGTNDSVSGVGSINSYYGNRAPCFSLGKGCRAARSCSRAMVEIGRKQSRSCRGEWVRHGALWSVQQVRRIRAFCYYFTHRNRCGLVDLRLLKKLKCGFLEITNSQVHKSALFGLLQIMRRGVLFPGLVVSTPTSPQVRITMLHSPYLRRSWGGAN